MFLPHVCNRWPKLRGPGKKKPHRFDCLGHPDKAPNFECPLLLGSFPIVQNLLDLVRRPKKKNWALENLPFSHEWILILDADECLPPEAEEEIREIVSNRNEKHSGYWINRRYFFLGKPLKHAYFPNWNLRLFKHKFGRYEKITELNTDSGDNEIHEHVIVKGTTGRLNSIMDHYAFPTIDSFIEKYR